VVINIERPGAFEFLCQHLGLQYPGEIWHNRTAAGIESPLAERIDAALDELGAPCARAAPFVLPPLLDRDQRERLDGFLRDHADRVML